jgi:hypothetical protein
MLSYFPFAFSPGATVSDRVGLLRPLAQATIAFLLRVLLL